MTWSSAYLATALAAVTTLSSAAGTARAANKSDKSEAAFEHRSRGHELERTKNFGAALVEYRTALRLDPKDVEASWRAGAIELRLGRAKAAVPLLERAVKGSLDAEGAEEIDLARAYEKVGKIDEARRLLEREAAENPTFLRVRLSLAELLSRHGQCEQAQAMLVKAEHEPAIEKKENVSFADDVRKETNAHCPATAPKHVATR